jgi:glycosyltransferase involved in cell wall biosynthesis
MNILFITPGTGSYYCGVCMRDNALVTALRQLGHNAKMLPIYLPIMTDEESVSGEMPIFFGGINVYLQQKFSFFRHTPTWVDKIFNNRSLLRLASHRSDMTEGAELGSMTVSMLEGETGRQSKEITKLVTWLRNEESPDIICLSTALQVGMARRIKEALDVPVICFFQGEDSFLDALDNPYSDKAWMTLRERAEDIDFFIAPSAYFANLMKQRLQLDENNMRVVPNGINLEGYASSVEVPYPPVIGFLSRMMENKGMDLLVDAFILLKKRETAKQCKLSIAGAVTAKDKQFIETQKAKLKSAGLSSEVEFHPNLDRQRKIEFLKKLSLFSVPAKYGEAFGLYLLEAMAAGVPVVQPRHAAFPELIESTGGGRLYEPNDPESLADSWEDILANPEEARSIGLRGRQSVIEKYSIHDMAKTIELTCRKLVQLTES